MNTITISKIEYFNLKKAELELTLLEHGGVDNWDWYGDSLNPDNELSLDEKIEQLKIAIFGDEQEKQRHYLGGHKNIKREKE